MIVRGCEFRQNRPQIELGDNVTRAIISDNLFVGAEKITNRSPGNVQIHGNAGL